RARVPDRCAGSRLAGERLAGPGPPAGGDALGPDGRRGGAGGGRRRPRGARARGAGRPRRGGGAGTGGPGRAGGRGGATGGGGGGPWYRRLAGSRADMPRALLNLALELFRPFAVIGEPSGGGVAVTVRAASLRPASPSGQVVAAGSILRPIRFVTFPDGSRR